MPEDNLIDWEQVRLNARRKLKEWWEDQGKQMPLYRRRESVTADEVIAQMKRFEAKNRLQEQVMEAVIKAVESTVDEICGKNGIENDAPQTSGIVKRLREIAENRNELFAPGQRSWALEAADEIERLRGAVNAERR